MNEQKRIPEPLWSHQLRRLNKRDLQQLRRRLDDPRVFWHPEAKATLTALVDELFRVRAIAVHEARYAHEDRDTLRRVIGTIKSRPRKKTKHHQHRRWKRILGSLNPES